MIDAAAWIERTFDITLSASDARTPDSGGSGTAVTFTATVIAELR